MLHSIPFPFVAFGIVIATWLLFAGATYVLVIRHEKDRS